MKKKNSAKKRLVAAVAMLALSSASLFGSTYAWFTMNKQVSVTGMEVKAHAEEGLLINEVATATDTNWDEQATGNTTEAIALRPASTKNLINWWHANSMRVNDEAGYGSSGVDAEKTVAISDGVYYKVLDSLTSEHTDAAAGSQAERNIYFENATFGSSGSGYDNGEGYYVKYTYYLKSSNQTDLTIASDNLTANVTATLKGSGSGTSTDLDPALRVGVMVTDNQSTPNTCFRIFAPVSGHDTSYSVTGSVNGTSYESVTPAEGNTDVVMNPSTSIIVPNVNTDGIRVDVYLWFEGEDTHCQSRYLTATLDEYDINIVFKDTALG